MTEVRTTEGWVKKDSLDWMFKVTVDGACKRIPATYPKLLMVHFYMIS